MICLVKLSRQPKIYNFVLYIRIVLRAIFQLKLNWLFCIHAICRESIHIVPDTTRQISQRQVRQNHRRSVHLPASGQCPTAVRLNSVAYPDVSNRWAAQEQVGTQVSCGSLYNINFLNYTS